MQLSKYLKRICEFFSTFPKSTENFEHFGKNDENQKLFFFLIIGWKKRGYLNA